VSEILSIVESAMRSDVEMARVVSQNIANAEVIAYRRQIATTAPVFSQVLSENTPVSPELSAEEPQQHVQVDSTPGTFRSTGEPLHFAVEGSGYFALQGADGVKLTRRGDFHIAADGTLTAASGLPVLGENGPIRIDRGTPKLESDGTLTSAGQLLDRFRLVDIPSAAGLEHVGHGIFTAPQVALSESAAQVRQGYLEASNVNPVGEIIQLMETVRHFEAAQKFARGYDEMLQKAISELGKVG